VLDKNLITEEDLLICWRCGSTNTCYGGGLIKSVKDRRLKQRYCRDCKRGYGLPPMGKPCPRCNSRETVKKTKNYNSTGITQGLYCKSCDKHFTLGINYKNKEYKSLIFEICVELLKQAQRNPTDFNKWYITRNTLADKLDCVSTTLLGYLQEPLVLNLIESKSNLGYRIKLINTRRSKTNKFQFIDPQEIKDIISLDLANEQTVNNFLRNRSFFTVTASKTIIQIIKILFDITQTTQNKNKWWVSLCDLANKLNKDNNYIRSIVNTHYKAFIFKQSLMVDGDRYKNNYVIQSSCGGYRLNPYFANITSNVSDGTIIQWLGKEIDYQEKLICPKCNFEDVKKKHMTKTSKVYFCKNCKSEFIYDLEKDALIDLIKPIPQLVIDFCRELIKKSKTSGDPNNWWTKGEEMSRLSGIYQNPRTFTSMFAKNKTKTIAFVIESSKCGYRLNPVYKNLDLNMTDEAIATLLGQPTLND
jgi:transposase-like protein